MNKTAKFALVSAGFALVAGTLSACATTAAAPSGMCGWIVGDGLNGNDRNIKGVVYEGENPDYDINNEEVHYVPCGPRNYLVTDGSEIGLDGAPIGDLKTPFEVYTAEKTPVDVQVDAFWQINQSPEAFTSFKELCNKYTCYTTDTASGGSNFATVGWNGMLQENFRPSMEAALEAAMYQMSDDIWKTQDPALKQEASQLMSEAFAEAVRATTGYNIDLFCGSGNSDWSDPTKPGEGEFTCTSVRFEIRDVQSANAEAQDSVAVQSQEALTTAANQSRYNYSFPLYGDQTAYWLGVQDAVAKCPSGSTCNIYLGNIPQ